MKCFRTLDDTSSCCYRELVRDVDWLTEAESRAWRGWLRMRALLSAQIARDLAADAGLSDPDYEVLSNLSETPGHRWRFNDLAARMLWSQSRLSHHISRMEQRGLVTREGCTTDGRGAHVVLTDGGMRAIEEAAPGHVASVRAHLIDLLTSQQIRALDEISSIVVEHLTDTDGPVPSRLHESG